MRNSIAIALLAVSLVPCGANQSRASEQKAAEQAKEAPLTNDDVIALATAKLGTDVILQKIEEASAVAFDVRTDALVTLKKNGLDESIIKLMIKRSQPTQRPDAASAPVASSCMARGRREWAGVREAVFR